MEEKDKKNDIVTLGDGHNEITFDDFINLYQELNELVNELIDNTGRSYFLDGVKKTSNDKFEMCWGS